MAALNAREFKTMTQGQRGTELSPMLGEGKMGNILDCMKFVLGTAVGDQGLDGVIWISWQLRKKVGLPVTLEDSP